MTLSHDDSTIKIVLVIIIIIIIITIAKQHYELTRQEICAIARRTT